MSRRRSAVKRVVLPDPIYGQEEISKFINNLMKDGKRSSAEKQFYGALDVVKGKLEANKIEGCTESLDVFKLAVENSKPVLEVKSRRVGGSNYQVPIEVRPDRRVALAYRWLIDYARKRPGRSMKERLANELWDAAQKEDQQLKSVKMFTKWQKLTKHLLTIAGRFQIPLPFPINFSLLNLSLYNG